MIIMKTYVSYNAKLKKEEMGGGGIPHTRRTECTKIKISQSDFSNLKFGKKVNISMDWVLILAEKKTQKVEHFQTVTDRPELGQILYFKGFVMKEAKYCFI